MKKIYKTEHMYHHDMSLLCRKKQKLLHLNNKDIQETLMGRQSMSLVTEESQLKALHDTQRTGGNSRLEHWDIGAFTHRW